MRIDLHTHSTASDGTQPPAKVVELAAAARLDVLALTDHDSAAGWHEAAAAAVQVGVTLVPGIEISTKFAGAGVHLLAYLPDPTYRPLVDALDEVLAGRADRLTAVLTQLQVAGIDLTEPEVRQQVGGARAIGRPHIADALVAKGIVATRAEAFDTWLNPGRPGYVVRYATPTEQMIRLVTESGGAAVIAHPWGRGSRDVLNAASLAEFTAAGLVGLEVDHQDHDADDRQHLRRLARELGLVTTGASDYHGDGKVAHDLGCNLTAPDQYDALMSAAARNAAASGRDVPEVVGP